MVEAGAPRISPSTEISNKLAKNDRINFCRTVDANRILQPGEHLVNLD